MAFRSGPFERASALAPGRRDARRDGAPRGFLVARRGADGRRRTGRLRARLGFARRRLCRSRAGRVRAFFLRATLGDWRGLRKANTAHGNRSQLVREAVQAYIQAIREGGDRISIRVPRYYLDLIDRLVAEGYFLSREHAVVRSVEDWFTRERVKEIQDHKQEVDKVTGKVVAVSTGEKDGVIPP